MSAYLWLLPPISFWMPEPIFVSEGVSHSIVVRPCVGIHVPVTVETQNNEDLLDVSFSVQSLSYQSWVFGCACMCAHVCVAWYAHFHGSKYTKQIRLVGCFVFCVIHVVLKESRQVVLPRTSCFVLLYTLWYRLEVLHKIAWFQRAVLCGNYCILFSIKSSFLCVLPFPFIHSSSPHLLSDFHLFN